MNAKQHSQEFLRKRKMLLLLPVIVIPLLSMVFYGMGGGKGASSEAGSTSGNNGYNMNLPGAKFNKQEGKMDKLSAYKKADRDSARLKDELREDPYHAGSVPTSSGLPSITSLKGINPAKDDKDKGSQLASKQDSVADAVLKKLDHLKQVLHQPELNSTPQVPMVAMPPGTENMKEMLSRLKNSSSDTEPDPQLDKLNGMLDKILQIQHPGSVPSEDTSVSPNKMPVFELRKDTERAVISDPGVEAFFTLDEPVSDSFQGNVMHAVVEGDQTLVPGGTIALRLNEGASINGIAIPKNNLLYGVVSLSGERMNVVVNSLRYNNSIYPVTLQVYDVDGLAGIRIPGAISREVAKESADQAASGIGMTTLDPSLGAQAASAGIQAAKTLFSRKVKLVRVSIPAGYQVFLKNIKK